MTRLLITGAAGHVGRALLNHPQLQTFNVLACDIAELEDLPTGVSFAKMDIRGPDVADLFSAFRPDVVVHLASIVTPPKGTGRQLAYEVDVLGTRNVLAACSANRVSRIVVTSSGAAYGYHADNPVPLTEQAPIRGNYEFPYAYHKRKVEELLKQAADQYPGMEQVILRVGTVLGAGLENQITALFHKPRLIGVSGSDSPFVFIWDVDLANILFLAATDSPPGVFNVAGDGALTIDEIAGILGKPTLMMPAWLLKLALWVARPTGLSRYGPEQVRFLQYRPVLDNSLLKDVFGYTPRKSSRQAFDAWWREAKP